VASVVVSHRLLTHSIYTLKLHRRGIHYPYQDEPEASPEKAGPAPQPESIG